MSSRTNDDFDDILEEISQALYKKTDINKLGKALGCKPADIGRCNDENEKQVGNYMGTLDLLRTWEDGQSPAEKRGALRAALLKAGFRKLADTHLPTPIPGQQEMASSSTGAVSAAGSDIGSSKREVTKEEITKLSKILPYGKYSEFFEALGYEYNYHQKILKDHPHDSTAACKALLEAWKTDKGGYMDDLDAAMKKAEVGGLIPKYKN